MTAVDNLTPEQRRRTMQAVKGKNTSLELTLDAEFSRRNWKYERHVAELPGKPDFVFRQAGLVVFVDGDFWHGWRFPVWEHTLSAYWQQKIESNRNRDRRNFRKLRRQGWRVVRIWEHQVKRDLAGVLLRIEHLLSTTVGDHGRQ